jgi:hypothetical protein
VTKGLTTSEVQAHLAEVYGAQVSRATISTITDEVLDAMPDRLMARGRRFEAYPRYQPKRPSGDHPGAVSRSRPPRQPVDSGIDVTAAVANCA